MVFGRVFDREGRPVGDEFALSDDHHKSQIEAAVDSNRGDRFVVAWMTREEDGYRVSLRRFDAAGKVLGEATTLPSVAKGIANGGTVAMAPDGRVVVAWNHHLAKRFDGSEQKVVREVSVMGQFFGADGRAEGAPWRINQFDEGQQDLQVGLNSRHAVWSALGQLAFAWSGNTGTDGSGVGLTLFAPPDLDPAAPPAVEALAALRGLSRRDLHVMAMPERDPNWADLSLSPRSRPAGPDFGFEAFGNTGWVPPDPDLAVGPDHVVAIVNVDLKFFDKAGNETFGTGLESWFGAAGGVGDTVALYDEHAGRFVVAAAERTNTVVSFFDIAVSDDDDPNGSWHKYRVDISADCGSIDFDNLGMTDDAYILAADCYTNPKGSRVHVLEKAPMLVGGAMNRTTFAISNSQISLGTTRNYDGGSTAYLVSTYSPGTPFLGIRAIKNAGTNPERATYYLDVGDFTSPPDAEQAGTSNLADTGDHRIKNGVVRNGFLYAVHSVDGGDGAA